MEIENSESTREVTLPKEADAATDGGEKPIPAAEVAVDVTARLAEDFLTLAEEFPQLHETIRVMLPDENTRRVGQSVAAASLPETRR